MLLVLGLTGLTSVTSCSDDDGDRGTISGSVTGQACTAPDDCTEQVVAGAQIEVRPASSPELEPLRTITDSDGEFSIDVDPGDWVVRVPAIPGMGQASDVPVTVSAGSTSDLPIEMPAE